MDIKVAYLGPTEKTYTGQITKSIFPDAERTPIQPIRNIMMQTDALKFDLGVIPLENIYNGHVNETLDSLLDMQSVRIVREVSMKIAHCLGALPNHAQIYKIMSKDQGLEQCSRYLCKQYPNANLIAVSSTDEAVRRIKEERLLNTAAIASEESLDKLEILAREDKLCPNNRTRFIVLGREETQATGDDKTFLAIHPPIDKPGILVDISKPFSRYKINLEYIQSRPDAKKGYTFYIELDGHQLDKKVIKAMNKVKDNLDPKHKHQDTIKILGSYANSHWKDEN